jgi:YHS domain-containing protein
MQRCQAMMQKAGIKPEMMQRCQVMMQTPIFMDSPCAIYGQANALKLSENQKKQLMDIENEARKKALAVLTDEQKKNMGDIPEKPMTMFQMCQQICPKMMSSEGKTGMCPMMQMMGDKGQEGSMVCPQIQKPPKSNDVQAKSSEQVTCPATGKPINKDSFTEYKGKKVYFCCGGPGGPCKEKFEANPEEYITKLPQFSN